MHLDLVSNPNPEKKIALESTRIGGGRGGDFAMARARRRERSPRVVSHAGTRGGLGDGCAGCYRLGGRSNNTILWSGTAGVERTILGTRPNKAWDPGVRSSNLWARRLSQEMS